VCRVSTVNIYSVKVLTNNLGRRREMAEISDVLRPSTPLEFFRMLHPYCKGSKFVAEPEGGQLVSYPGRQTTRGP